MDETYEFKAPDGQGIRGSSEHAVGTINVHWETDDPAGPFDYGDDQDMCDAEAFTIAGESVFVADDGDEWLASHLITADAEPLPEHVVSAMREHVEIGRLFALIETAKDMALHVTFGWENSPVMFYLMDAHSHVGRRFRAAATVVRKARGIPKPEPEPEFDTSTLAGGLLDMIHRGRLTPDMIPDDFEWLSVKIAEAVTAD